MADAAAQNDAVRVRLLTFFFMTRVLFRLLLLLCLLLPAAGVWAQGFWRDLPPDERRQMRQQMRDQMREQWQQERELRRDDGPPRWRDLPPEDRRQLREEMREHRGWQPPPEGRSRQGGPRGGEGGWR